MSSPISGIILIGLSMIIVVKSFTTIKQNKTKMLQRNRLVRRWGWGADGSGRKWEEWEITIYIYEIIKEQIQQNTEWKINYNSIFIPQRIPPLSWALSVTADFFSYKNVGNSSQPQSIIKSQRHVFRLRVSEF